MSVRRGPPGGKLGGERRGEEVGAGGQFVFWVDREEERGL